MSRGAGFHNFSGGVRAALEVDIGPVEDEPCEVGPCNSSAVYRLPWPVIGGDIACCAFHLARYRDQHPELYQHVQEHANEDLDDLATVGDRFLHWDEVPPRIRAGDFRRVLLDDLGYALFEAVRPREDGGVVYLLVKRSLDTVDAKVVHRSKAGEFIGAYRSERGVYAIDDDVEAALFGGTP